MMSNVLLGLVDEKVHNIQTDFCTNKIGGIPDWITVQSNPTCSQCSREMVLVIQLYCPLGGSLYHRTLYIFTCDQCKDLRWTVIRQQKLDESAEKIQNAQKPTVTMATEEDDWGVDNNDWGVDTDDWGPESNDELSSNQNAPVSLATHSDTCNGDFRALSHSKEDNCAVINDAPSEAGNQHTDEEDLSAELSNMEVETDTQATNVIVEDVTINESRVDSIVSAFNMSSDSHVTPDRCLTSFYISVVEEPTESQEPADSKHIKQLLKKYEQEMGAVDEIAESSSSGGGSGEKYEKASYGDSYFHKFSKKLARSPEQIMRFEWNGSPLYISKPDPSCLTAAHKTCSNCGSGVVFELQILPGLINSLKWTDDKEPVIEFGTVIVYTCKASCWTDETTCVHEHVIVQPDPDQHLFKQNVVSKMKKSYVFVFLCLSLLGLPLSVRQCRSNISQLVYVEWI